MKRMCLWVILVVFQSGPGLAGYDEGESMRFQMAEGRKCLAEKRAGKPRKLVLPPFEQCLDLGEMFGSVAPVEARPVAGKRR